MAAISSSVGFNSQINKNNYLMLTTYHQISNGVYMTGLPLGTCMNTSDNPCSKIYILDPGVQTFTLDTAPQSFHIDIGQGIMIW